MTPHMTINKSSEKALAWVIEDVRAQKDVTWLCMAVFPLHVLDLNCWTLQRPMRDELLTPAVDGRQSEQVPIL